MENNGGGYRWGYRDKARIISIVDIVMSTLNLGNTFLHFLAVSAYSSWLNSVDPDHTKVWVDFGQNNIDRDPVGPRGEIVFAPHTVKKLAWMLVLAQFAIHFSQLVFAINLYTGTARTAPAKAHSACRLWFITSSLLLGILGIRIFFHHRDSHMIYNMSEIIFRAVGMYIVGEYAKQIKRDGNGLIPPPVYFSSHAGGHHHHGNHLGLGRGGIMGNYPIQQSIPLYFSPHHVESPPKYEEIIQQIDAAAASTVIPIPETGTESGQVNGADSLETSASESINPTSNTESDSGRRNDREEIGTAAGSGLASNNAHLPSSPPKYEDIIKSGSAARQDEGLQTPGSSCHAIGMPSSFSCSSENKEILPQTSTFEVTQATKYQHDKDEKTSQKSSDTETKITHSSYNV